MRDLIADGNSVLVDHDTQILSEADWIVEMGPEAGADGGQVIAQGYSCAEKKSCFQIGPFLSGEYRSRIRKQAVSEELFDLGKIHLSTGEIHTVKPLEVDIPQGRLTVITGVSGSGKTTLILESLIPGLEAEIAGEKLPGHVKEISAEQIRQVKLIDATPIGINVRSTVATYANVHDELRKVYARTPDAKALQYKAGDFSTIPERCAVQPAMEREASVWMFSSCRMEIPPGMPGDQDIARKAEQIKRKNKAEKEYSLPEIMAMDVKHALTACEDLKAFRQQLQVLQDLGLGYLTLGEETPSLSGGEAQRLKLASEMGRQQSGDGFCV